MTVHVDSAFPGTPVSVDTSSVSAVNTAGAVAMTLTNVRDGLAPTTNLPVYFNAVKTSGKTWQIQYRGVSIPKTAATLVVTVGTQTYKQPLFVT